MKLSKEFVMLFVDFKLEELKNEISNFSSYDRFINQASMLLNQSSFQKEWSLGGTSNSYSGYSHTVGADAEPEFTDLDDFLLKIAPNMGILQYKKIMSEVETETNGHSDYYGGCVNYAKKIIHFNKLDDVLQKLKLIEPSIYMEQKDMIEYVEKEYLTKDFFEKNTKEVTTKRKLK